MNVCLSLPLDIGQDNFKKLNASQILIIMLTRPNFF